MSGSDFKPPYRLFYVGLVIAALANVLISVTMVASWHSYAIAGNVSAAVVCLGAVWLIRQRKRGRL